MGHKGQMWFVTKIGLLRWREGSFDYIILEHPLSDVLGGDKQLSRE